MSRTCTTSSRSTATASGVAALLATVVLALVVPTAGLASAALAEVPAPTVTEIPYDAGLHGHPMWDSWFDLSAFGYEQHEYLVAGTATATGSDQTAEYATRIIVARPSDPAAFHGTVMLDWVNVTAQFENAVNTASSIQFLLRDGWGYVHVSAQAAGLCCTPLTPQVFDPARYAELSHPGDEYANDIFSQVAKAIRAPADVDPMGGLDVEVVIAAGQSQGGSRLSDYIVTTAAQAGVIDAVLQQAGGTKNYEVAPSLPVIHLLGDREGSVADPTPWPTYRLWEVAASAHQDSWIGRQQTEGASRRLAGAGQLSRAEAESLWASAGNFGEQLDPREEVCIVNGALFPTRYADNAALFQLDRWVRTGVAASQPPRYQFDGTALAKDADRNTLGGLRLPPIEAAVARYIADLCNLGGITIPFTEVELINRYGDHASWYALMVAATEVSVSDGYLLVEDALDLLARSCAARPRFMDTSTGPCGPEPNFTVAPAGDTAPAEQPPAEPAPDPLPATGGGWSPWAVIIGLGAVTARRSSVRRRPA